MLNPEIITHHDPEQMMKSLRFGAGYRSRDIEKEELLWPEGFLEETEKCHGCSKCTTVTTATRMCPIYKVTRDEAASPKAKANLLRAIISGALEEKTRCEKAFQQVMDLCANCGSCASRVSVQRQHPETCDGGQGPVCRPVRRLSSQPACCPGGDGGPYPSKGLPRIAGDYGSPRRVGTCGTPYGRGQGAACHRFFHKLAVRTDRCRRKAPAIFRCSTLPGVTPAISSLKSVRRL